MGERPARWLEWLLWVWVAVALVLGVSWTNPDPPLVPRFEAIADALPAEVEGPLGFASGRPDRQAGYAWSAARYAFTPRPLRREERRLVSRWVLSDQLDTPPRYRVVRDFGDGVRLLRQR